MTLEQQAGKEELLILKTNSFHTINIFYNNISSEKIAQCFYF